MATKTQLFEKVLDNDAARSKATDKLEREIRQLFDSYFVRVQAIILSNKELSLTDAMSLQAATKVMGQLKGILEQAGFSNVLRSYADQFETLAQVAAGYYEPLGLPTSLAGISRESLTTFVQITAENLGQNLTQALIPPIQSALLQANFGTLDRQAVVDQVIALEPSLSPSRAITLVDDAFAQFQRGVIVQKADALGLEIFIYQGPDDDITSPQCEAMLHVNRHGVDGMLYKDEITVDLHPALRADPLIAGGHPRCRHQWSPVTLDYAISQGFEPRS